MEWMTVYSGYAMAVRADNSDSSSTSQLVCMDKNPNDFQNEGKATGTGKLRLIYPDYGFFYPRKPMPCAVCAK